MSGRTTGPVVGLLLYVAGDTRNSVQAGVNLRAFCRTHLPGRHEIEIVDVLQDPKRALADRVFMTPTLLTRPPSPVRRIVGTLDQAQELLHALGLEGIPESK